MEFTPNLETAHSLDFFIQSLAISNQNSTNTVSFLSKNVNR